MKLLILLLLVGISSCCPIHGRLPQPTLRPLYSPTDAELQCLSHDTYRKIIVELEGHCKANQVEMMKIIESQK